MTNLVLPAALTHGHRLVRLALQQTTTLAVESAVGMQVLKPQRLCQTIDALRSTLFSIRGHSDE